MYKRIELRSDTCTYPTKEMLNAMANAKLGNDGFGEDPTVKQLEKISSELFEKESALFVPSGTMGNLLAFLAHDKGKEEVIFDANHHSLVDEYGGVSVIAHRIPRPINGTGEYGIPTIEEIKSQIKGTDSAIKTGLIWLENTHNNAGGICLGHKYIEEVGRLAHKYNIPVHMDGARIFNASISMGVKVKELCKYVDSVMFCLSKGLGCPVGSMLIGNADFINNARIIRRRIGGQMRQAGVLAAAGIIALNDMINRLRVDHNNAKKLAGELGNITELGIDIKKVQTNIVLCDLNGALLGKAKEISDALIEKGVFVNVRGKSKIRMVTHKDVSLEDIEATIDSFKDVIIKFKSYLKK